MQSRLRKGYGQQNTAAMHHGRAVRQRREILPGKLLPCSKALGRGGLPCPGIPAAGAAALHRLPQGTAALPAGAAGIRGLGRLAALASLLLFALLCGSSQPELFLCRIGSGGRQRPRRASLDQTGNKMPLAALTGPDPALPKL